jgi:hypothetical protein
MDRFAARRKLLRGSLSAPLVLTVASPAALARQSFEACLARAADAGATPDVFIAANQHDMWLRKPVKIYKGVLFTTGNGTTSVKKATGNDQASLFYELMGQVGRYYPVDSCVSGGYPAHQNGPDFVEDQQTLVFVNDGGAIVGFGPCRPNDGFPVTTSCWASFGGMMQL